MDLECSNIDLTIETSKGAQHLFFNHSTERSNGQHVFYTEDAQNTLALEPVIKNGVLKLILTVND